MKKLFELVDLGWDLAALNRSDEAIELMTLLSSSVKFDGNYNIWTPVGYGICLQARLYREKGKKEERQKVLNLIREHPFHVSVTKEQASAAVEECRAELEKAVSEKSRKWACHTASRMLMKACFYRETDDSGFPHSGPYSIDDFEVLIGLGIKFLGEHLH